MHWRVAFAVQTDKEYIQWCFNTYPYVDLVDEALIIRKVVEVIPTSLQAEWCSMMNQWYEEGVNEDELKAMIHSLSDRQAASIAAALHTWEDSTPDESELA